MWEYILLFHPLEVLTHILTFKLNFTVFELYLNAHLKLCVEQF